MLIVLFLVSHCNFLFVPCGGLSWLPVSFLLYVKYTLSYRIVSIRRVAQQLRTTHTWWCCATLVPSLELRIGPACEAGLSAGMRRERVSSQKKKERRPCKCPSVRRKHFQNPKTPQCWVDVDETWHLWLGEKLLRSGILIFSHCAA